MNSIKPSINFKTVDNKVIQCCVRHLFERNQELAIKSVVVNLSLKTNFKVVSVLYLPEHY